MDSDRWQRAANAGARIQRLLWPAPRTPQLLAQFAAAGVDVTALAARLQSDGAAAFVAAWNDLMSRLDEQRRSRS
jgi:hypothetical protein